MIAELEKVKNVWPQVKSVLSVPSNAREYNKLCRVMDDLVDEVGENENHRLAPLLDTIGSLLEVYEEEQFKLEKLSSIDILKELMKEHSLTQSDLKEIASQGVLSEILHKKRALNLRQVKLLAKRFNVSPAVFID
jgi:HTH-type transcriptional regulator / antitoxin HigA